MVRPTEPYVISTHQAPTYDYDPSRMVIVPQERFFPRDDRIYMDEISKEAKAEFNMNSDSLLCDASGKEKQFNWYKHFRPELNKIHLDVEDVDVEKYDGDRDFITWTNILYDNNQIDQKFDRRKVNKVLRALWNGTL